MGIPKGLWLLGIGAFILVFSVFSRIVEIKIDPNFNDNQKWLIAAGPAIRAAITALAGTIAITFGCITFLPIDVPFMKDVRLSIFGDVYEGNDEGRAVDLTEITSKITDVEKAVLDLEVNQAPVIYVDCGGKQRSVTYESQSISFQSFRVGPFETASHTKLKSDGQLQEWIDAIKANSQSIRRINIVGGADRRELNLEAHDDYASNVNLAQLRAETIKNNIFSKASVTDHPELKNLESRTFTSVRGAIHLDNENDYWQDRTVLCIVEFDTPQPEESSQN